jgi:hypothetical protein
MVKKSKSCRLCHKSAKIVNIKENRGMQDCKHERNKGMQDCKGERNRGMQDCKDERNATSATRMDSEFDSAA